MASVNKVILVGKLGRDPEMRHTPGGAAVCTLNVATTETWNDNGSKQERTEWHRVQVWGKPGENCAKYLTKGKEAYIEGRIQTKSWDDAKGVKRYSTDIVASTVQFLGGANTSHRDPEPANIGDDFPRHETTEHLPSSTSNAYQALADIPF